MRVARTGPLFTAALTAAFVAGAWASPAGALDRACREKPTSACVLQAAVQLAQDLPHDSSMMGGGKLASAWALLGQVDRAVTAAGSDKDPNASLRVVVNALAQAGRFESALQVARAISWPKWKSAALLEIAEAALEAGQSDLAGRIVEEARLLQVTSPLDLRDRSPSIAGLLTRVGRLDQALEVANDMSHPNERLVERRAVAKVLAEMGRIDEASRIAGDMQDPDFKCHTLLDIAAAHAHAKGSEPADRLFEAAWQASLEVSRTFVMRGLVQNRIVAAMAAAGRLDRAEALADRISDAIWRGGALAEIGAAYLVAGQAAQARRILDLAKNVARDAEKSGPSSVLADVAMAMARGGAFEESERLATSITDAGFRSIALHFIADQFAVKNQIQHATRIVAGLPTEYRAAATRRVLLALAATGARERRMAMVSEALELAMKPWPGVNTRSPRGRTDDVELRVVTLISIGRSLAEAGL